MHNDKRWLCKRISIYGSKDQGIDDIELAAQYLPPETQWVKIEGANLVSLYYQGSESAISVLKYHP